MTDPIDRNGEPAEADIGCLVMVVCAVGIWLILFAALWAAAAGGC